MPGFPVHHQFLDLLKLWYEKARGIIAHKDPSNLALKSSIDTGENLHSDTS